MLLSLLSCSFKKQSVVYSGFSPQEFTSLSFGLGGEGSLLKTLARIDFVTDDAYYPVKAALIFKRPSYWRLELLPVIGSPDFLLTVNPSRLKIFIPSRAEFYSGKPTVEHLKKFIPWPMNINEMVMVFTGTYPSLNEKNIAYQAYWEGDVLRVDMTAPSGSSQIVWVGKNNQLLKLLRKDNAGEELYRVEYVYENDHRDFPEKITVNMADGTTSLSIQYADVQVEQSTDLSIFELAKPDNVKEIILR